MRKIIIIYNSKTGFSKRYAQWLAEDVGGQIVPYSARDNLVPAEFDALILVGGLYAGTMRGLKWLEKQLPKLTGKRVAALAVGASTEDSRELAQTLQKLFDPLPQIHGFYCRGGLDYAHMGAIDRAMMAGLRAMLKKSGQTEQLREVSSSFDAARRENLEQIESWLQKE